MPLSMRRSTPCRAVLSLVLAIFGRVCLQCREVSESKNRAELSLRDEPVVSPQPERSRDELYPHSFHRSYRKRNKTGARYERDVKEIPVNPFHPKRRRKHREMPSHNALTRIGNRVIFPSLLLYHVRENIFREIDRTI
ncbi:hypothetical protein F5B21DRAFT_223353 [Xylaria acuta]|nr:hypothetical protein F5B21DRAFT_223353 [Xylaria acuta]